MSQRPTDELLFDAVRAWGLRARGKRVRRVRAVFEDGTFISMTLPAIDVATDEAMTSVRITSPGCCADIVGVLRDIGHRLVTDEVLEQLDQHGKHWGESTVKATLAEMVAVGMLDNKSNVRPRGYGLPDW